MTPNGLLTNLNSSQHAAVTSVADTVAILAGPGCGKTHTLTSRTAWLLAQGLQPWNIIVATFTVKAAREMKERIGKLIGNGLESKLILGTFHSICRRYLARYGHLIKIKKDFGIADSADTLAIVKRIVKRHNMLIDPKVARSRISTRKAKGQHEWAAATKKSAAKSHEVQEFETCYTEYEAALQRSNLLDYDDLLLRCVELLRRYPDCVENVEAVLIDEFQDTNQVQLHLMKLFATKRNRITIVGDPDQSIYGFRAAEVKNYKRMLAAYPDTVTIALEKNYRSSAAILLTAMAVIEQDTSRVAKSLVPTHTVGSRPVLRKLASAGREADWIVTEIQRCLGMTGSLLDLNDFAILLRSASLSRLIESAFGKAGIAYRMVGGLRFYDRLEVKTILDYLRVINQPDNNDALARIINVPSRRIGETTIRGLLDEADQSKVTLWSLILGSVQGSRGLKTKLTKQAVQGLTGFVNIILTAENKMNRTKKSTTIVEIIDFVIKKIYFEKWLEEHHGDAATKARWANVQELIVQASDFMTLVSEGYEDESLPEIDGLQQADETDHLAKFLANVSLASEVKKENDEGALKPQVTISTIHAAKGLEWPIVFIPATYQGSIPHSRAEDSSEERRLLYVAMTRAKVLLHMSYPLKSSNGEETTLSPFLSEPSLRTLLGKQGPSLLSSTVQTIAQILRRPPPSLSSIQESSAQLESIEDDRFPLDGRVKEDAVAATDYTSGNSTVASGQWPPQAQRVEQAYSTSKGEQNLRTSWKPTFSTTVDAASGFTSAATTLTTGFTTATLCLNSMKRQLEERTLAQPRESKVTSKVTLTTKSNVKVAEGQRTLNSFLGKPEPQPENPKVEQFYLQERPPNSKTYSHATMFANGINRVRDSGQNKHAQGVLPELSAHCLGSGIGGVRPRPVQQTERHPRNHYVFLSSSPPTLETTPVHNLQPEQMVERPRVELTSNPPILPCLRHAVSMHTTTVSLLQSSGAVSTRTLGVKRSMNDGWTNSSAKRFVPPTMKRPAGNVGKGEVLGQGV